MRSRLFALAAGFAVLAVTGAAVAEKKHDEGANDTEVKIGQTMPYSGPASAFSTMGKVETAYFSMLNSTGGINGRKVTLPTRNI